MSKATTETQLCNGYIFVVRVWKFPALSGMFCRGVSLAIPHRKSRRDTARLLSAPWAHSCFLFTVVSESVVTYNWSALFLATGAL